MRNKKSKLLGASLSIGLLLVLGTTSPASALGQNTTPCVIPAGWTTGISKAFSAVTSTNSNIMCGTVYVSANYGTKCALWKGWKPGITVAQQDQSKTCGAGHDADNTWTFYT